MSPKNDEEAQESLETSIVSSIVTAEESASTVVEVVDAGFDAFVDSEILENLPFIGAAYRLSKGLVSLPDHILHFKLAKFLRGTVGAKTSDREKWLAKLDDSGECERFGRKILLLIDSLNDDWKAELLGRLMRAELTGEIDHSVFLAIAHMISSALPSNLQYLIELGAGGKPGETGEEVEALLAQGFLDRPKKAFGDTIMPAKQPVLTEYGTSFIKHCSN